MKIRPCVFLSHQEKFLFLTYQYPSGNLYALPGGGIEPGETLIDTLKRELLEELSLSIKVGSLLWVCETEPQGKNPQTLHLVFEAHMEGNQVPKINPEHTSANGFVWLTRDQFHHKLFYPNLGDVLVKEQDLQASASRGPYLGLCPKRTWV